MTTEKSDFVISCETIRDRQTAYKVNPDGRIIGDDDDNKSGTVVDMQTANLVCEMWDALSEKNRKRYAVMASWRAIDVAWKVVGRINR